MALTTFVGDDSAVVAHRNAPHNTSALAAGSNYSGDDAAPLRDSHKYGSGIGGGGGASLRPIPSVIRSIGRTSSAASVVSSSGAAAAAAPPPPPLAPTAVVYATLVPIDEAAPEAVKTWVTAFFNAPTPMATMRAIASGLGLMEAPTVATAAEEGGGEFAGGQPFQRVASIYAPSSVNDGDPNGGRNTPRTGAGRAARGGGIGTRGRRDRARPLGFVGLL